MMTFAKAAVVNFIRRLGGTRGSLPDRFMMTDVCVNLSKTPVVGRTYMIAIPRY